jgi:nicotinate-nucleotide adenylyltransferase
MKFMIGIFGGTFDPVHCGHLRAALEVQQTLELQAMIFVPVSITAHRLQPVASFTQRMTMLQAATNGLPPQFLIDDLESKRPGPSYTIDTVIELHQKWPNARLNFLIGWDAFLQFFDWHQSLDILNLANLIVMQRGQISNLTLENNLVTIYRERQCQSTQDLANVTGRIMFFPVTSLDISSSLIRSQLATGKSIRYLTPDAVINFINKENLYR